MSNEHDNQTTTITTIPQFNIVYADPPWSYANGGRGAAKNHYRTMSLQEIAALRVRELAADNAALFMWGTWPNLPQALAVMGAWGFAFKTCAFVWLKANRRTACNPCYRKPVFDPFMGGGFWTRANTEFCLLGVHGDIRAVRRDVRQVIYSRVSKHSEKPAEARARIVALMGDRPRVDLFARQRVDGWAAWGNEVEASPEVIL